MNIKIALYRGKSFRSKIIKFRTMSEYSHAAVVFSNGKTIESWDEGVTFENDIGSNHTPGTPVDLFTLVKGITFSQYRQFVAFLENEVGKKYDWNVIFLGTSLYDRLEKYMPEERWFCSELIEAAFRSINRPLISERVPVWNVLPGDFYKSKELEYIETVFTHKL
jgi:uncharacterized protein YycO